MTMMINDISKDSEERMKKSLLSLDVAFNRIRTGRAHPSVLDSVKVNYYGSEMPIQQVANVVVEDARTDPRTNKEVVAQLHNRTIINVPLLLAGARLGVVGMGVINACVVGMGVLVARPWAGSGR